MLGNRRLQTHHETGAKEAGERLDQQQKALETPLPPDLPVPSPGRDQLVSVQMTSQVFGPIPRNSPIGP